MNNVDYKALYLSLSRQNGDLSMMVDKYQQEIIPGYDVLLKKARAERDNAIQGKVKLAAALDAAMRQLKAVGGCRICARRPNECTRACIYDHNRPLWKWIGPDDRKEAEK